LALCQALCQVLGHQMLPMEMLLLLARLLALPLPLHPQLLLSQWLHLNLCLCQ
jgi:hypothetical protein